MQENEFEKRVREQMDEFSLVPNEAVWKQVEARIGGEKKKRTLLFWFVSALLLVGGITWWMIESRDNVTRDGSIAKSKPAIITSNKAEQQINDTNKIVESRSALRERSVDDKENANKNKHTYTTIKTEVRSSVNNETPSGGKTEKVLESKTPVVAGSLKPSKISSAIENESKEIALHKYYKSAEQLKADSLQRASAISKKTTSVDTLKVAPVAADIKHHEHKWKLGVTAFGGVSRNTNGIDLISAKSAQANAFYSFSSASPSTSGAVPVVIPKLTYKRSASYGFGMFAERQIGKRTAISLGIDYHYFSSKSIVGNRVDSSLNLYDTALQKQTTVQSFYKVGQSTLFSNKYNLIQLPVNLLFRLNKNSSKPLLFSLGLSPSFLIASKALYVNRYKGIYYEEKQQFNNFLLFGQSGLLFTALDSKKCQFSLGPVVQYDFNSMSKWQTQTNQHLTFIGIKSNITFK
jgi:hypothetical protein